MKQKEARDLHVCHRNANVWVCCPFAYGYGDTTDEGGQTVRECCRETVRCQRPTGFARVGMTRRQKYFGRKSRGNKAGRAAAQATGILALFALALLSGLI